MSGGPSTPTGCSRRCGGCNKIRSSFFLLVSSWYSHSQYFSSPMFFFWCLWGGGGERRGEPSSEPCERGALSSLHVFFFPSTRGRGRNSSSLFSPWSPRGDDVKTRSLSLSLSLLSFSLPSSLLVAMGAYLSQPVSRKLEKERTARARDGRRKKKKHLQQRLLLSALSLSPSFSLFLSLVQTHTHTLLTSTRSPRRRSSREETRTCPTASRRCR